MNFVIVDLETTWLTPYRHWITEIAAVRFDWEKIIDSYQSLIHPERHIPSFITKLTGIDNDMVAWAPTISQELPRFLEFLWDDIFVAHNSSFDLWFLNYYNYEHFWSYIKNNIICTKKLTKKLLPEIPKRNLGFLCEHFQITNSRAHRALSDVHATTELLKHLIDVWQKQWRTMDEFLDTK